MRWCYQCPRQRDVYDWRSAHSSGQHTTGVSSPPAPQQGEDTNSYTTHCSHTWVQRACCALNSYLHFSVLVQANSDAMIPAPPLPPQTSPLANMFNQESSRPEREPGELHLTYYIDLSYRSHLSFDPATCLKLIPDLILHNSASNSLTDVIKTNSWWIKYFVLFEYPFLLWKMPHYECKKKQWITNCYIMFNSQLSNSTQWTNMPIFQHLYSNVSL